MRILHIVAGEKWTGVAAVVFDWTRALVEAGLEAQFAFVGKSPLARRISGPGWIRPLLTRPHGVAATLRDLPTLRRTLVRERFDVVHSHLSHDHYLAALAAAGGRARVVRTIHHSRHVEPDPVMRSVFRRTRSFAFGNAEIARAFGFEAPGPVHSPIVDGSVYTPGPRPGHLPAVRVPEGAFVAGTVGKLAPGRGHEEAIAAAAPLPGTVLLHVGKGEHRPALDALADRLGTSARNLWAGYQDETLPAFYRAMDAFLFTASGSQQGQRAILEAMATGLPVVALPVPGVSDLVTDGVEGFVAAGVPEATAALDRLAGDPQLRARMGAAARRRVLAFSGSAFAATARTFYASALTEGFPGSPSGATWARPSDAPGRSSRQDR